MTKEKLTIDMKTAKVLLIPITAREYYNYCQKELPISRDWGFHLTLGYTLSREAPDFGLAECYAALKTLFGESTTMFDDYKCSFGYTFLLEVCKKDRKSQYILNFTDLKGGITFFIDKVLDDSELDKYDRNTYHGPFEDEFSKEEIRYFMGWFTFYLVGFMESYQQNYDEEFFRSIKEGLIVFGYKDGKFFNWSCEDTDEFYQIIEDLEKENIPYNQVKPNEEQEM